MKSIKALKLSLILLILLIAAALMVYALHPSQAVGVRLIYKVKPLPGEQDSRMDGARREKIIESLANRVDPNGVLGITFSFIDSNRLEIDIPEDASYQAATNKLEKASHDLESTNVHVSDVLAVVEDTTGDNRDDKLMAMAGGIAERRELLQKLAKAYDRWQEVSKAFQAAKTRGNKKASDAAADAAAVGKIEFDKLQTHIEDQNLTAAELQDILTDVDPAERNNRLNALRSKYADFPERLAAMDSFVFWYSKAHSGKAPPLGAWEIKQMLRGSGILEFHIVVQDPALIDEMKSRLSAASNASAGLLPRPGDTARWFKVASSAEVFNPAAEATFEGQNYILLCTTPDEEMVHGANVPAWSLANATREQDPTNRQIIVGFEFDDRGAKLFSHLTGRNIGRALAIVLDDKVISAPVIRSQISKRGTIDGGSRGYAPQELNYLVSTLKAGSVPAVLSNAPLVEEPATMKVPSFWWKECLFFGAVLVVGDVILLYFLLLRRPRALIPPPLPPNF